MHPPQNNILLVSQCLSLPLQHPRMGSKGWFSAGWKEGSLDSLIIEEIKRLGWSQKHNFWAQNNGWTALQTGELLPLQEKRGGVVLTGSCGLKESCLFSHGCDCKVEDERPSQLALS